MALGEHIVEIARLLGGELVWAEVVEEEQVRREPAPQFPLEGVVGPGLRERLQEQTRAIVGASRSARVTTALRLSTTSRRGTPLRRFQAVEDGLEIPLETRAEQRVAAVPTGDEDSVPLPRPVGGSGHCPNRPKSTSATSPSGGSTTRTVTAAAPNPSWRRAKRRGRPMWGGPVAVIAATLASVGSVLPRHRSVATPAACYLAVRSRAGLWFQWAKSFGEPVGRILQILAGACAEPQIFEQWPSICYSPNQRTIMNRGISDVQGSSHP
jgi:hypothetical protein